MDKKLEQSLDKLIKYIEQGTEFAIEQAPLYARELVEYTAMVSGLYTILCVTVAILSILTLIWAVKNWDKHEITLPLSIFAPIFLISSLCVGIISTQDYIKAKYAPRVLVMEHLGKMSR